MMKSIILILSFIAITAVAQRPPRQVKASAGNMYIID